MKFPCLQVLVKKLGYVFSDLERLQQALTHSSFVYENNLGTGASNERLEFLGDAVLELLISDLLYKGYPERTEGELSKARAGLVCEASLSAHARQLGLGRHLRLGRGEASGGGADKDSILSDAMEAIIGAIYLDGGFETAKSFVQALFKEQADTTLNQSEDQSNINDPKSSLQEAIQKTSQTPLIYNIIKETGPAHQKEFTASVSHKGQTLGTGTGKSKKEAERQAAARALYSIKD